MPSPSLKELCLEQIVASAERFLNLQWSDGRFELEAECASNTWNQFHQQYILAAALLYSLDLPTNPWYGNHRLWTALLRNGRHLVSQVDTDGTMMWRSGGREFKFVCQRLLCAWFLAYEMLEGQLPADEAQAWREAIQRGSEWLWQRHVFPRRNTKRFTAHDDGVGTGTNHFSLYLSLLYRLGTKFEKPEWVELTADLMHRLIAAQQPGGYWEEHHGPALGYNYLTYHGVDEYTTWSGDETGLPALRAGLELHRNWTYPDGLPIECIDGRMRHLSQPMLWGLAGFSRWSDGRGYVRLLLERTQGATLGGEALAKLAQAYLMLHEGAEETPPQKEPRSRAVLDGVSVVRKEGPWVTALSGQCSPNWEDNVFMLDRQALVSVWREGSGPVVDGSNSKHNPELATFCRGHGAEADSLPLATTLLPTSGSEEAIRVRYATFDVIARVRIADSHSLDLIFSLAEDRGEGQITATIVPSVAFGETISLETSGTIEEKELGTERFTFVARENGVVLVYRGVRMQLPGGAYMEYPISPFNSYAANNTSPPSAHRMIVRCPVDSRGFVFRILAAS